MLRGFLLRAGFFVFLELSYTYIFTQRAGGPRDPALPVVSPNSMVFLFAADRQS